MVAYFCHHLSDSDVDLSDLYVDLLVIYVDLSDHYVDLSGIKMSSQLHVHCSSEISYFYIVLISLTAINLSVKYLTSRHHYVTSRHNILTSRHY